MTETGSPGNADVPVGTAGESADGDVGAPRKGAPGEGVPRRAAHKGWYSRGHLPHHDVPHLVQSITYRLADSLPQGLLADMREELKHLPETRREVERRKRIERWLDAGTGCCALGHPEVARYVQDSLMHFHGERYRLHAWCVMPNHVHVLIEPLMNLGMIVQGWKSHTARWVLRRKKELALEIPGSGQLWMREFWDRFIRDAGHYERVVEYIHQNPVQAGLCRAPEAWPWSSAFAGAGRNP